MSDTPWLDDITIAEEMTGGGEISRDPSPEPFPRFDLVAFLDEDPPEYDYLLDGLLERGELCWLAGRGKVGKSILALFLLNAALGGGGTFLGREVGAVDWGLYIDGENREATVRRRVHLAGMTSTAAALIDYRSVRGVDLGSASGLEGLRRLVDRPGRGLVILDSLVALHRADEDKAGEVRRFADKLRSVLERPAPRGSASLTRTGRATCAAPWTGATRPTG